MLDMNPQVFTQTYYTIICLLIRFLGDVHTHENLKIVELNIDLMNYSLIAMLKALEGSLPTNIWEKREKKEAVLDLLF